MEFGKTLQADLTIKFFLGCALSQICRPGVGGLDVGGGGGGGGFSSSSSSSTRHLSDVPGRAQDTRLCAGGGGEIGGCRAVA